MKAVARALMRAASRLIATLRIPPLKKRAATQQSGRPHVTRYQEQPKESLQAAISGSHLQEGGSATTRSYTPACAPQTRNTDSWTTFAAAAPSRSERKAISSAIHWRLYMGRRSPDSKAVYNRMI